MKWIWIPALLLGCSADGSAVGSDGGGGGSGSASGDGSGSGDTGPGRQDGGSTARPEPLACPDTVELEGHEGQFLFQPTYYCGEFIAGVPNKRSVVVGSDIHVGGEVYEGAHDCTLARDVRYHVDWGDGAREWTPFFRCDVMQVVEHVYDAVGVYTASVYAEDHDGLHTRCRTYDLPVVAEGQDLTVAARNVVVDDESLTLTERVENYGTRDAVNVELRYLAFDCEQELEVSSRRIDVAAGEILETSQTIPLSEIPRGSADVRVRIDPDDEIAEYCPDEDGFNNVDIIHRFTFCNPPKP